MIGFVVLGNFDLGIITGIHRSGTGKPGLLEDTGDIA